MGRVKKRTSACQSVSSKDSSSSSESSSGPSTRRRSSGSSDPEDFRHHLFKVLQEIYDDTGITKQAMDSMNVLVNYLFVSLVTTASAIMRKSNRTTMTANDIQSAVRQVLPGELQKHAVSEGTKAVAKFKSYSNLD